MPANPVGDQAAYLSPSGGDDTAAIQAAVDAGQRVHLGPGIFLTSGSGISADVNTQIVGNGRSDTTIRHAGDQPAIRLSSDIEVQSGFLVHDLTIEAQRGILINSNGLDEANDGVILGVSLQRLFIRGTATTTGATDPLWSTTNLLDGAGAATPSASTTTASQSVTYADIESRHGYAISMTKVFDSTILDVSVRNSGIAWITHSCDINRWIGGRMHECGWFHYDRRSGTFGSQNTLLHVDLLHNRRAGGITHDGVKFPRVTNCYYECYVDSALWIWQRDVEGSLVADNRVDDTYYQTSRITPLMLISSPEWYNKIERNHWNQFSTSWVQPVIRVIGIATVDGNHAEVLASTNNSLWWPKIAGDDLPGVRSLPIDPRRFAVGNTVFPPGPVQFTLDGSEYAMSTTAVAYPTAYMQVPSVSRGTIYLRARAKVAASAVNADRVVLTIELLSHTLVQKQALWAAGQQFPGFSKTGYTTVEIPLTIPAGLARPTDWIRVTWPGSAALIVFFEVSETSAAA
jgi:hypothetical protein